MFVTLCYVFFFLFSFLFLCLGCEEAFYGTDTDSVGTD